MKTYCFLPILMLAIQMGGGLSVSPAPTNKCPVPTCTTPDPNNPCRNKCRRDRQCGVGGKCCPLCGCNVCIRGTPRETCATKQCPDGQVCVERGCDDGVCGRARCVPEQRKNECPVATCTIPDPNNPCRNKCRRDRQCGVGGKCCPLCGCNVCIGGTPRETCATKQCPDGQVCVERGCYDGVCGRARCVPEPRKKPGFCPLAAKKCVIETNPVCPENQCTKDSQCRWAQKCCLDCDGCVLCRSPISG